MLYAERRSPITGIPHVGSIGQCFSGLGYFYFFGSKSPFELHRIKKHKSYFALCKFFKPSKKISSPRRKMSDSFAAIREKCRILIVYQVTKYKYGGLFFIWHFIFIYVNTIIRRSVFSSITNWRKLSFNHAFNSRDASYEYHCMHNGLKLKVGDIHICNSLIRGMIGRKYDIYLEDINLATCRGKNWVQFQSSRKSLPLQSNQKQTIRFKIREFTENYFLGDSLGFTSPCSWHNDRRRLCQVKSKTWNLALIEVPYLSSVILPGLIF